MEVNAGEQAVVAGNAKPAVTPVKLWDDWTGGMGDHGPVAFRNIYMRPLRPIIER